jgi:hypothetical protein
MDVKLEKKSASAIAVMVVGFLHADPLNMRSTGRGKIVSIRQVFN